MHLPRGGPHHHCCHLSELDCQAIEIGSALGLNVAPGPSARHLDSALESATVLHVVISETATVIPNPAASFADGVGGRPDASSRKKTPRTGFAALFEFQPSEFQKLERLVDVVLLPMQRWIGLDDDALFGPALEFFHQFGLASL